MLRNDPELVRRLGAAALDYVRAEREWLVIVRQYQTIYDELIRNKYRRAPETTA
jgi:glycosyltransferase involved in cell wall biosynthesis